MLGDRPGATAFSGASDLAELLPDAVVVMDEAGLLRWGNAAAERLLGVRADEALGKNALSFVHPDDIEVVANALRSIRNKEVGTPIEIRLRAKDGWKLVEVVGTNLLANPRIGALVLSIRDLTERRRWEVAGDEIARFRALVHNAATIIMLLDGSGHVESVSAAITRLLGHDQELVEGGLLSDLVVEEDREGLQAVLGKVADERPQTGRVTTEVGLLRAGSREAVPFELTFVNLLDDPTVKGIVVSGHDVTELRQSLVRLAEAQQELIQSERLAALGELASMIGHEIRNPLGAAHNFLFLVRDSLGDGIDPAVADLLSNVERQMNRAITLSEDLISYVRQHEPAPAELNFGSVIEELLDIAPPPRGIGVVVEGRETTVKADANQLLQMLANLLVNAYQAMPEGGSLRIEACEDDGWVEMRLEDTGGGIHPDVAPRIFDAFFSTKAEGTGLGLAIVTRLAEAHHGRVTIENAPGGGAIATLCLPRRAVLGSRRG